MSRLWLLLALAVLACRREPPPEALYRQAYAAFQQGELKRAAELVRVNAPRFPDPSTEIHWNWRLLSAELARTIADRKRALEILADPPPDRLPNIKTAWHVRRCAAFSDGQMLDEARAELAAARQLTAAYTPSDIRLAADLCAGFIALRARDEQQAGRIMAGLAEEAAKAQSDYYRAAALVNLAFSAYRQQRYDISAFYGEQAVEAAGKAGAKRFLAPAAANLGSAMNALGDYDRALPLLERALTTAREIDYRVWIQNALGEQGNLRYYQDRCDQAVPLYKEAHQVADQVFKEDAAKWAGNLAVCELQLEHPDEAEKWNDKAAELSKGTNYDDPSYYRSNRVEIFRQRKDLDRAFAECRSALAAAPRQSSVERALHAQLASLHIERGNIAEAKREFETALRDIEQKQRGMGREEFRMGFFARLIRYYQAYVDALVGEQDYVYALQIAERSRARVLANRLKGDVQSSAFDPRILARKSGLVLMSYWLTANRSYLWVVAGGAAHLIPLPSAKELDPLVASYRNTVEKTRNDPFTDPAGKRLYDLLIAPAAGLIPVGSHVVIVPSGSLHQLNLEMLPVPGERPHYWIEDVIVSVAPSLAILETSPAQANARSVLLIGAPQEVDSRYPELPGAREEVASLRGIFSKVKLQVHEGREATPDSYLASEPDSASIIHFAAHGESNQKSPLDSAVILSTSQRGFKLYARDIVGTSLRADLVTISGCRTAGSKSYEGEGTIGFAWAFLQAGARSVIAGLWDVRDRPTAELMRVLYEGIASGRTAPDALRAAKLALIHGDREAWRRPLNWAAFQTYVRAVPPKPRG